MADAHVYVSMHSPLKLLGPPNPRQRATGTMHSYPALSIIWAILTFVSKFGLNVVSAKVMAQELFTFGPNIPNFN
ncbi:Uncharacterised protein [Chlamydia trachomatis]|nr:Uncharacterised protein [Chlamydia trachomatis]